MYGFVSPGISSPPLYTCLSIDASSLAIVYGFHGLALNLPTVDRSDGAAALGLSAGRACAPSSGAGAAPPPRAGSGKPAPAADCSVESMSAPYRMYTSSVGSSTMRQNSDSAALSIAS